MQGGHADRLVDHAPIGVDTYDLGEQVGQP
jgi:hypothetical protein